MATTQGIMIFRGKGVIKILDGQIQTQKGLDVLNKY